MNRRILSWLLLAGFGVATSGESVRKVDFKQAPEMKELAGRARQIGNEMYPKVLALLADGTSKLPQQFDVVFKKRLPSDYPAMTAGRKVYINAHSFTLTQTNRDFFYQNPTLVETVLIHEMAHVAQQYKRSKAPLYWREGVADYVRYKLVGTAGPTCPQCSFQYPHYTSGYWCLGAFLLHLEATHGSNIFHDLNVELRRGTYSDQFFARAAGRSLNELWLDFQRTPAFTPVAAELNKLREAVGSAHGKSRDEEQTRFVAYIRQQPGGELALQARELLSKLAVNGRLPGWRKGEQGEMSYGLIEESGAEVVPASRTFYAQKSSDPAILYHYLLVRPFAGDTWKLEKAWRTGPDARVIEEYAVPLE